MALLNQKVRVRDFLSSGLTGEHSEPLRKMPHGLRIFQALINISVPMRVSDLAQHVRTVGFTEFTIPLPVGVFAFPEAPMFHREVQVGHVFVDDRNEATKGHPGLRAEIQPGRSDIVRGGPNWWLRLLITFWATEVGNQRLTINHPGEFTAESV